MGRLIRFSGQIQKILPPITLTAFQTFVGGFIRFIDLESGDILVVNEEINDHPDQYPHFNNPTAATITGHSVIGDAVVCSPSEVA